MEIVKDSTPSREFYLFLKYNKIFEKEKIESFNEYEEGMYQEFGRLWNMFSSSFSENDSTKASTVFGSLASMFGFSRHYCSVTGAPIIGPYFKIGGKIVSKEAYESYRIIQEMEKKHSIEEKNKKDLKNKTKTLTKKTSPNEIWFYKSEDLLWN